MDNCREINELLKKSVKGVEIRYFCWIGVPWGIIPEKLIVKTVGSMEVMENHKGQTVLRSLMINKCF